jgi:hypothetical protein
MGLLDSLTGNLDLTQLAAKAGLSEEQAQQVLAVLPQAQVQPGDTAENAANASGLPLDQVRELLTQIGGGTVLGTMGQATEGLDRMFKG